VNRFVSAEHPSNFGNHGVRTICCVCYFPDNLQYYNQFGPDAVGVFRVEVTDSGVGLTEDEQRNIFGEFTQFNKNELQGGGNMSVFAAL
jgi:signal transduction histidine kinase